MHERMHEQKRPHDHAGAGQRGLEGPWTPEQQDDEQHDNDSKRSG
jgi:hypothetical protein